MLELHKRIGKKIATLRKENSMTQEQLAEKLSITVKRFASSVGNATYLPFHLKSLSMSLIYLMSAWIIWYGIFLTKNKSISRRSVWNFSKMLTIKNVFY